MAKSFKLKNLKYLLSLVIVVIASFVIFIFYTLPNIQEIKLLSQKFYSYRLYLEKLYFEGQLLKNVVKELKEIEPHLQELSQVIVGKNDELAFITSLEKLAENNKINQSFNLNPNGQVTKNTYRIVPIQINFQSDFSQLIKYLMDTDKLDYYINIKSLTVNRAGNTSNINNSIEANTYWEN